MKHIRILIFVYGFIVILVLPVLHILSHITRYEIISFKDYLIAVLVFFVMVQYSGKEESGQTSRD